MMTRRELIQGLVGSALAATGTPALGASLRAAGVGGVRTPAFYRHDLGSAPGRLHEPSADAEGNLWTSPLDGTLWRYHTPTGRLEILSLKELTGREWKGLHLWPVAHGRKVFLCCPTLTQLWVYDRGTGRATPRDLPPARPTAVARCRSRQPPVGHRWPTGGVLPQVYGGFAVPGWRHLWLYAAPSVGQKSRPGVLRWDSETDAYHSFPCPYALSGELYMSFVDRRRKEIWGSTYTGNDLVRFDVTREEWSGHWRSPLAGATPTPTNAVFGDTLYISDHLNGRLVRFDARTGEWGRAIPIPGFREWFGYVGGGVAYRGLIYFCHSTWTGGDGSIDGNPHHFIGSWSVFDPKSEKFSRLEVPIQSGETVASFQADYGLVVRDGLYILAVSQVPPHAAVVLRSRKLPPAS